MNDLKKYVPVFVFWIIDSVLLVIANSLYPENFVLGTAIHSKTSGAIFAGFVWTLLVWYSYPLTMKMGLKVSNKFMPVYFLLANFVSLWLVARLAPLLGFGVASYLWVLGLAVVANIAQWFAWSLGKFKV